MELSLSRILHNIGDMFTSRDQSELEDIELSEEDKKLLSEFKHTCLRVKYRKEQKGGRITVCPDSGITEGDIVTIYAFADPDYIPTLVYIEYPEKVEMQVFDPTRSEPIENIKQVPCTVYRISYPVVIKFIMPKCDVDVRVKFHHYSSDIAQAITKGRGV